MSPNVDTAVRRALLYPYQVRWIRDKSRFKLGRFARQPASASGDLVRFAGASGTAVPLGQQVFTAQGIVYATTAAAVIGVAGTVDVAASASAAGVAGNQSPNTPATVSAAPVGLAPTALLLNMTGGADVESDDSLLSRLLLWMSEEAQGGNSVDYRRWTLGVPGVDRAYVFDCRRGAGTVDVVPMPASGLPGAPLLAAVQAVLDVKRPVGMRPVSPVMALAPTAVATAVTASFALASGFTLAGLIPALTTAIDAVFAALAPGETLVRNELIAALMNVAQDDRARHADGYPARRALFLPAAPRLRRKGGRANLRHRDHQPAATQPTAHRGGTERDPSQVAPSAYRAFGLGRVPAALRPGAHAGLPRSAVLGDVWIRR